jgi:HEAT repeat protein
VRKVFGLVVFLLLWTVPAQADDVKELIKKLASKDNEVRRAAAQGLAEAGKDAKPAVAALIKALKDEDRFVRRFSAQAIGNIGPDAKTALKPLAALINDDKENVREAAVQALAKMGSAAVPALTAALRGTSSDVQQLAVKALSKGGSEALPGLLGVVKDPKMLLAIRTQALDAVLAFDAKTAKVGVPILLEVARDRRNRQLRLECINGLGKIATKTDTAVISYLEGIVKDEKLTDNGLKNTAKKTLKLIEARKK